MASAAVSRTLSECDNLSLETYPQVSPCVLNTCVKYSVTLWIAPDNALFSLPDLEWPVCKPSKRCVQSIEKPVHPTIWGGSDFEFD
jgi:hypothetical protein